MIKNEIYLRQIHLRSYPRSQIVREATTTKAKKNEDFRHYNPNDLSIVLCDEFGFLQLLSCNIVSDHFNVLAASFLLKSGQRCAL